MKGNLFPTILLSLLAAFQAAAVDLEPTAQDYGVIDSEHTGGLREQSKPVFQWIDITSSGVRVVGPGSDLSSNHNAPDGIGEPVTLPQPFPFYGQMLTEIVPSSNGYLSTDPDEAGDDNVPQCPPAKPAIGRGNRINVLHSPMLGLDGVYYKYFELSPHPHRRCGVAVFSWIDYKYGDGGASCQALLFDTGDILMQYATSNSGTAPDATIGLQTDDGDEGISYACGGSLAAPAGVAVLFRSPMVVVENGSPILYGTSLAEGIAQVRNGGRIRFANDTVGIVGFEDTDPNRPPNDPDDDPDETDLIILPAPITLSKSVVIDGTGGFSNVKTFTRKEIDCNGHLGFDIQSGGRLLLVSTGIINGGHTTSGGAIRVNGALKMCDTNVHHNKVRNNNGGAIGVFGNGFAWLSDSNFYENSARASGGAVFSQARGLRIDRCAFFNNEAGNRGGAVALDVTTTSSVITNSTFAYNKAGVSSSAVESLESNTIMRHCTIAENGDADDPSAGVLGADEGTMSFYHCIIGPNREPALNTNSATFTSNGYNLDDSGTNGASGTLGFSNAGDGFGESKLTPLGLHGGRVFTMMPLVNSNALDQGSGGIPNPPDTDARGLPRLRDSNSVAGVRIDIGAVEGGELVVVDTANDEFALFPGGNTAATSLEEAIVSAPEGGRIVFHSSLSGAQLNVVHYYDPVTCQPEISAQPNYANFCVPQQALIIDGSNLAAPVTINRNQNSGSIMSFTHGAHSGEMKSLTLHSLRLTGRSDATGSALLSQLDIVNTYDVTSNFLQFSKSTAIRAVGTDVGFISESHHVWLKDLEVDTVNTDVGELSGDEELDIAPVTILEDITATNALNTDCDHGRFERIAFSPTGSLNVSGERPGPQLSSPYGSYAVVRDCSNAAIGVSDFENALIERCHLVDNSSDTFYFAANTLHVDRCGVIRCNALATPLTVLSNNGLVSNLTFSGNSVARSYIPCQYNGGYVMTVGGDIRFENCTLYGNSLLATSPSGNPCAGQEDGPFFGFSITGGAAASVEFANSIVARNIWKFFTSPDWEQMGAISQSTALTSGGHNLFDTAPFTLAGSAQPTDLENANPMLFPLRDNGGPFPTHMPMAGSPAVDGGPATTDFDFDTRGYFRKVAGIPGGSALVDIGAVEATEPFAVTFEDNQVSPLFPGQLRHAVSLDLPAPYENWPTRIVFPTSFPDPIMFDGTPVTVGRSTIIDGTLLPGGVTFSGGNSSNQLAIQAGNQVSLAGISFEDGNNIGRGGAIENAGDLFVTLGAFHDNYSDESGGAIANVSTLSQLEAVSCTFSGNEARSGGTFADTTLSVRSHFRHCTIAGSRSQLAPAGLFLRSQSARLVSNLFADNIVNSTSNPGHLGEHASNNLQDSGANLFDSAEPLATHSTNLYSADPGLQPLADNGGFSQTMALEQDSGAINAGYSLFSNFNDFALMDARGFVRNLLSPNGITDIGAHETGSQDTDGDLMPDDWELANALNPNDPSDAGLDNDWDGLTNLDEYQNGSLPWDNYSKNGDFKPDPIFQKVGKSDWEFVWTSTSLTPPTQTPIFYNYQVETSKDLITWDPYGAPYTGAEMQFTHPLIFDVTERFFRIHFQIDLSGQNLSGADFSNADLSGADFSGANLSGADLSGACLVDVNLDGADLTGADLADTDLTGAMGASFPAFPGTPEVPVATSLPALVPLIDGNNFSTDHPDAPGDYVSHATIGLMFQPGTSVGTANTFLANFGLVVTGAIPAPDGSTAMFHVEAPTANHAQFAPLLNQIIADPAVQFAAPDLLMETNALPDITTSVSGDWTQWNPADLTSPGNYGAKYIRAPQLWNFNEAIQKRIDQGQSNRRVQVGVLDASYRASNPEMAGLPISNVNASSGTITSGDIRHGTHVMGIIGAPHDNSGMDGVFPFARMHFAYASGNSANLPPGIVTSNYNTTSLLLLSLRGTPARVVNMSMGFSVAIANGTVPASWVQCWGNQFAGIWVTIPSRPVLCVSAGNRPIQAQNNSAPAFAGLNLGVPSIFVTQNLDNSATVVASSGQNGNIAAPGTNILSASFPSTYEKLSGTSMATPHVTGTVAWLFSLKPGLTNAQIDNLLANNINARGPANGLDAWAAAMDIDRVAGGDEILRMWCDIDDGSLDGNQRLFYTVDTTADQPTENPTLPSTIPWHDDDIDGDGGIGDGTIDMADYRRFRDWTSICHEEISSNFPDGLDGFFDNPKNDPNRNGDVGDGYERFYPRNDLNGDGSGDWFESAAHVPGVLGAFAQRTDLQVLRTRFADPFYEKADIDALGKDSADIHFNFYWFAKYALEHAVAPDILFVEVEDTGNPANSKGPISMAVPGQLIPQGSDLVLTFKTGSTYRVRVYGYIEEIELVGEEWTFNFDTPLEDHWFSPRAFEGFELN